MLNPESAFAHGIIFPLAIFGVQEEVDNKYVIVPLKFTQTLLEDSTHASALEIKLAQGYSATIEKQNIAKVLGQTYKVTTRFELRESFFKVMQSEKTISYVILVFILLIAAFNTIGSLYMMVIEKKNDLFVYASLGLRPNQAAFTFGFQSILISLSGGLIGLLLGSFICLGQQKYNWVTLQNSDAIGAAGYPVILKWEDIMIVFFTLLAMGILTSIIPALKAAHFISQRK
jgi:lipoprotein-releasing system permease protein